VIIDFHAHIYPESVEAKILPAAEKKLKITVPCTGSPDDLSSRMKSCGIVQSVVLPLARGQEDVSSLNDWIQSVCRDGLLAFGAIHPLMDGLETELDRLKGWKVKGVKMMPLLQQVYPDDPRCGRFYDTLIDNNMILVTHSGRDPLDRKEVFGTPKHFSEMIKSYPELKVVLAHLGGLRMWDDVYKYLLPASENVFFDTSYASFYMGNAELEKLIRDIGVDRVLFGSDYPWEDPGRAVGIINSLDLSEQEKKSVLGRSAARLLNS
jgi:predicted TIM-barrel fold metal-dependent hydrolase